MTGNLVFDDVDKLRAEGRFGDVVLNRWGHLEMYVELLTSYEIFGMWNDVWTEQGLELLKGVTLDWKIRFLRLKGSLTKEEFEAIKKFQKIRNNQLFHMYGNRPMTKKERETIMDVAVEAASQAETAYHEVVELGREPAVPSGQEG